MSKIIGIASEGPTDYMVLKTVIDRITGEDNKYRALQPEPDMLGRYGNGWKGVWRWCKETASLTALMNGIEPGMDLIIIQMDGDVIRKEKEVHCLCDSTECKEKEKKFPLYCDMAKESCPIDLPCKSHESKIGATVLHGKNVIEDTLSTEDKEHVIITIPCDSTDAWIVAAYEEIEDVEKIEDPWKNVIAKGKYYHNVRVRGDKKNTVTYSAFLNTLFDNWDKVVEKCYSAKIFEQEVKKFIDFCCGKC